MILKPQKEKTLKLLQGLTKKPFVIKEQPNCPENPDLLNPINCYYLYTEQIQTYSGILDCPQFSKVCQTKIPQVFHIRWLLTTPEKVHFTLKNEIGLTEKDYTLYSIQTFERNPSQYPQKQTKIDSTDEKHKEEVKIKQKRGRKKGYKRKIHSMDQTSTEEKPLCKKTINKFESQDTFDTTIQQQQEEEEEESKSIIIENDTSCGILAIGEIEKKRKQFDQAIMYHQMKIDGISEKKLKFEKKLISQAEEFHKYIQTFQQKVENVPSRSDIQEQNKNSGKQTDLKKQQSEQKPQKDSKVQETLSKQIPQNLNKDVKAEENDIDGQFWDDDIYPQSIQSQ